MKKHNNNNNTQNHRTLDNSIHGNRIHRTTNSNTNLNILNANDSSSEDTYTNTTTKSIEWSIENEEILVEWCDIAQCYKWLNTRAHNRFSFLHAWFTIPTIILSTITGTASFGQSALPENIRIYSPVMIGSVNIFIGILTTIQQYLKISELNESHRVMAIAWDKFARNIKIELSKAPSERMDAGHFIKHTRQEFDRLMETSPMVPISVINQFNDTFVGKEGSKQWKKFKKIKKPDICDTLTSSNDYRHHWYIEKLKSLNYKEHSDSEEDMTTDDDQEPCIQQMEQTLINDPIGYSTSILAPITNMVSNSAKSLVNTASIMTYRPSPKAGGRHVQTHGFSEPRATEIPQQNQIVTNTMSVIDQIKKGNQVAAVIIPRHDLSNNDNSV